MIELVDAIENHKPVDNIRGLAYKKNDEILLNPARIVNNMTIFLSRPPSFADGKI